MVESGYKIGVLGLGYVGLPIALVMNKKYPVRGYDTNSDKVSSLNNGIDPSNEIEDAILSASTIEFYDEIKELKDCNIYIVAVPTPVDRYKTPNLDYLTLACELLSEVISKNDLIIFESTVYPGCTEEVCVPIIESKTGLKLNDGFRVGYSPERIVPGVDSRQIENVIKVVSGSDDISLKLVSSLYASVIPAGVYEAESIKIAEAAKIVENTQRNVNIALMNELSMIFDKLNIDTSKVLQTAGTKWNFHSYHPGLVGGHCIDVDPYYLTYKAESVGYYPEIILASKKINSKIPVFIAKKIIESLLEKGKTLAQCKVLIKGITFKENVADHRNSKVVDLYMELQTYNLKVDITDPLANASEIKGTYDIDLMKHPLEKYDAMILAVPHKVYLEEGWTQWQEILKDDAIIFDVKSQFAEVELPAGIKRLSL